MPIDDAARRTLVALADLTDCITEAFPSLGELSTVVEARAAHEALAAALAQPQGEPVAQQWRGRIKGDAYEWTAWTTDELGYRPIELPYAEYEYRPLYAAPPPVPADRAAMIAARDALGDPRIGVGLGPNGPYRTDYSAAIDVAPAPPVDAGGVLPCDVMVAPAAIFRKGVPLRTVLDAIRRREREPEVRIDDEAIAAFRRALATPTDGGTDAG